VHNEGDDWVNLDGWALNRRPDAARPVVFPPILLEPQDRVVVFASGKDRADAGGGELHASFRLELDGEYLALSSPRTRGGATRKSSRVLAALPSSEERHLLRHRRLGREPLLSGSDAGKANAEGYVGFVADTKFSEDRSFRDQLFDVAVTSETRRQDLLHDRRQRATEADGVSYTGPSPSRARPRCARRRTRMASSDERRHTDLHLPRRRRLPGRSGLPLVVGGVPADYRVDPR